MISLLSRAARLLQRSPRDAQFLGSRQSVAWKLVATGVLLAPILSLVVPLIAKEIRSWSESRIEIPLPANSWHVLYRDAIEHEDCNPLSAQKHCLAGDPTSALWQSEERRGTRSHFEKLPKLHGTVYWIGTKIPVAVLKKAQEANANQLLLGYVTGGFQVWLDGRLLMSGEHKTSRMPIRIAIPMERLSREEDLPLAIRIHHNSGRVYPDFLGGHLATGLSGFASAEVVEAQMTFLAQSRPWLFFSLNLLASFLFLFFWWASRKKQEYWYMGAFGLVQATLSALGIDLVHRNLDSTLLYSLEVAFRWYEGVFALFLGLAFARSRRSLITALLPTLLVTPVVLLAVFEIPPRELLNNKLYGKGLSFSFAVGALACLLQCVAIWKSRFSGLNSTRFSRLVCFALGMSALSVMYLDVIAENYAYSVWFRFMNFGMMAFLSAIVLSEYREQEKIIEKAPVSPYHRRPTLPDRLTGAIALLDIKGSEDLFRLGSARGEAGSHMHACLSFLWTAMTDAGGTVLQTEGDQLKVFFENKAGDKETCLKTALESFFKAQEALDRFSKQEEAWGFEKRLYFRGALSYGDIRPVWQDSADGRFPSWIEAGSENVLVDVARYMEMERSLNDNQESSMVVMAEATAATIHEAFPGHLWKLRNQAHIGKHQKVYRVATFSIAENAADTKAKVA